MSPRCETSRRSPLWAGLALAGAVAGAVLGCKNETKASPEPEPAAAAQAAGEATPASEPAASAAPAEAKQKYSEEPFTLSIEPVGDYEAGKAATAKIELSAKNGYKCNDKYPYKLKLKKTEGVDFPADVVKKEAVELEKKHAVMTVAFTPKTAGKKTIAGQFAFSVCTEERCLVERRDLALDIDVK